MGGAGREKKGVCPDASVRASASTAPVSGSVTRTAASETGSGVSPAVTDTCKLPVSR